MPHSHTPRNLLTKSAADETYAVTRAANDANWDLIDAILSKYNFSSASDPEIGDDSGDGYSVGSRWYNYVKDIWWQCADATLGAAVWTHARAWLVGTVDPTTEGAANDMYYNSATHTIFGPKTTVWPAGILLDGTDGTNGTNGTNGTDGRTILTGTVDPTTEGEDGDLYYNTVNYKLFGPKATTWPTGVLLKGTNGTNGRTLLSGVIDPTTEGEDGDFYINTATSKLFGPKATTWPIGIELIGAVGATGAAGTPLADIIWEGAYNAGTTYSAGDGCTTTGHAWVSIQNANTGNTPPNTTWWAEVGGSGSGGGLSGPYTITHDGGAEQAIVTTSALCETARTFMVCDEAAPDRIVTIGWAADPDALMTNAEVPHTLNGTKSMTNPLGDEGAFTSATALIATVGGSGDVGVWRYWIEFKEYT